MVNTDFAGLWCVDPLPSVNLIEFNTTFERFVLAFPTESSHYEDYVLQYMMSYPEWRMCSTFRYAFCLNLSLDFLKINGGYENSLRMSC